MPGLEEEVLAHSSERQGKREGEEMMPAMIMLMMIT